MSPPSPPSATHPGLPLSEGQKRKRVPRALLACEGCRSRKLRCDQLSPCSNCLKRSLECEYRSVEIPLPNAAARQSDTPLRDAVSHDAVKRRDFTSSTPLERSSNASFTTHPAPYAAARGQTLPSLFSPRSGRSILPDTGFDEVNKHTQGTEYYGPVSVYSFLRRLRTKAHNHHVKVIEKAEPRNTRDTRDISIVNLLHSSDFPVASPPSNDEPNSQAPNVSSRPHGSPSQAISTASPSSHVLLAPKAGLSYQRLSNLDIEKECIRQFFSNLHMMHPMIDQTSFLDQCERYVWGSTREATSTVFLALYNAVLAVGAIITGEDASFMRDTTSVRQAERYANSLDQQAPTYPPLKLAKLFFERAKTHLGDVFEACSLESTQTLLLMAIFCQNALKPHSCYLYCGMAVRCALAIGLSNYSGADLTGASATWWGLYSFEIEMCAATGRESSLKDPAHYRIPFPNVVSPEDGKQAFHTQMIGLAQITADLAHETTDPEFNLLLLEKSRTCLEIDRRLETWKNQLPTGLNLETASLVEPEWLSKQKAVLRIRFLNCRILIHRPFLIAATATTSSSSEKSQDYSAHVSACVSASVRTIESLYEIYKHRPYFRTWWYNTTYTMYASMILLYTVLSHLDIQSSNPLYKREYLIHVVQKSLEIFQSMDMVAVARRCFEVTQEMLDIAKRTPSQTSTRADTPRLQVNSSTPDVATPYISNSDSFSIAGFGDDPLGGLDLLIDPNLMDGFAPFPTTGDGQFDYMDFNSVLASGPFG